MSRIEEDLKLRYNGQNIPAEDGKIKPRVDLIPSYVLLQIGKVFGFGATKYETNIWKKAPTSQSMRLGSALRHIYNYMDGVKEDEESGLNHIDHAITQLMMVREYERRGIK